MNESLLIDNVTLSAELEKMFFKYNPSLEGFEIVERQTGFSSTFEADIITCLFKNAPNVMIRCKYLKGHENNQEGGHRGGVEYEARIYEERLAGIHLPLVSYYGSFIIPNTDIFCMVIQYMDDCIRIDKSHESDTLAQAAAWIGKFHSLYENFVPKSEKKYDEDYYRFWVQNTINRGSYIKNDYPWIYEPCEYFKKNIEELLTFPVTLIHGEYYPHNILLKEDEIYPIDWESAAIAFGEIDLAGLIENWGEEYAEKAIKTYVSVRWPNITAEEEKKFEHRLKLAKLYLHMRWIGTHSDFAAWEGKPTRFKKFYKRLELLKKFSKELV
ncbi:MAG: phosphotransferase [Bacteroidota bacterium]|nr:phosphotransferase [Bacteroidota bacterium]